MMNFRPFDRLVTGVTLVGLMSSPVSAQSMKKAEVAAKPVYTEAILCLKDSDIVAAIMPDSSLKKGTAGLGDSLLLLPGTKGPNQKREDFFTFKKGLTESAMKTISGLCQFLDRRSNGAMVPLVDKKTITKAEQKIYQNAPDSTKDFSDALTVIQKASPKKKKAPSSTVLT